MIRFVLIASLLATPVLAQDGEIDFCNVDPDIYETELANALVGQWENRNLEGYMIRNGRKVALPPLVETIETMSIIGGELSLTMNDGQGPYTVHFVDPEETGWTINPDEDDPAEADVELSTEDFANAMGCDSDQDFVRLYAEGTSMGEAGPVEFQVFMFVINEFTIYGMVEGRVPGHNALARRIMQATKF